MNPTDIWIKICANTSLEDALLAADAGADAVGFVFASSPRRVTPVQAAEIVPHLPATLEKIGVFVDASLEEIENTVRVSGLTGVQLHFDAAPDLPARLRGRFGPDLRILRVVHFETYKAESAAPVSSGPGLVSGHDFSRAEGTAESTWALAPEGWFKDPNVDAILVDSRTASAVGGTGQSFDWALASKTLFRNTNARDRIVAAGGLSPENVAEAIATLRPWGVDVVSGVEAAPGRKDPAKVRAFIAQSRNAAG
jgi:phosphoribosylanthranilate isomerase